MRFVKMVAVVCVLGLNVFSADVSSGYLDVINVQAGDYGGKKLVLVTVGYYNNTASFKYYGFEVDGSPMADYMLSLVLEGENRWLTTNVQIVHDDSEPVLIINGTANFYRAKRIEL